MKVRGPQGVVYVSGNHPNSPTKWFVKDKDEKLLFETEEAPDIAIQWAIDYQSSCQKVSKS